MSFSFNRLGSIFKKECRHIVRDPFTMLLSMLLPLLVVLVLGNCIEFNLKEISVVVVDHDKSEESRRLIESFNSSNYFKTYFEDSPDAAFSEILKEDAKAAIVIPPQFGKNTKFGREKKSSVQILLDGADNSSVGSIMNYIGTISFSAMNKIMGHETKAKKPPLTIKERYLFNPELNSRWFAIPGLAAVIIALVAILLTSLTICKEWEQGSMELLISTPVESSELIIGKISPYAILASIGFLIVYFCARVLFKVPMAGSNIILFSATLLFIMNYLGIGLFISVTTKIQQIAVQKALTIGLLPTAMLSGFIFPIEYMPTVLQYLTVIFPARWYVEISRNEFLRGGSFSDLLKPFSILLIQSILIIRASISRFKRKL